MCALGVESVPFVGALQRRRVCGSRLVSGRLGDREAAVLTCGVGPSRARRRTRQAIEAWKPELVINAGTCGTLTETLSVGDQVTGQSLLLGTEPVFTAEPLPGLQAVTVATVDEPVWDAEARAPLQAAGAQVCEMEAAAVAQAVGPLPFFTVKVVSDTAGAQEDPHLQLKGLPLPVRFARFQARALDLVRLHLRPALLPVLAQLD